MAIWYVDCASGNDSTGDGSYGNPYKTEYKVITAKTTGDEIRVAKTTAASTISGVATFTFTHGSVTVTTSADASGSIAAGDYIGKTTAAGDGSWETFYRVASINSTTITLEYKYYGTSEGVAAVKKQPFVTCAQGQGATIQNYINNTTWTISGGWTLATQVQDGETWLRHSFTRTTSGQFYNFAGTGGATISKMNLLDVYVFSSSSNTLSNFSYCTAHCYAGGIASGASRTNVTNCVESVYSTTYLHIPTSDSAVTWTNVLGISRSVGQYFYWNASNLTSWNFSGCYFMGGGTDGYYSAGTNNAVDFGDSVFYGFTSGINQTENDGVFKNAHCMSCGSGISLASNKSPSIFENISTTSCTYGIGPAGTASVRRNTIYGGTSTSDSYGYYNNYVYGFGPYIVGRTFVTPVNYAVSQATFNYDTAYLIDCSIDVASVDKLVYNPTGTQWSTPRYIISNCTNGQNGIYFPYYTIKEGNSVYRTTAPAYTITFVSEITNNNKPVFIWSAYVDETKSYTVSFYLKKGVGWTGSIQPLFALNGKVIQTETAITSLTTDWVKYEYTISAATIPNDGELRLGLILNANTVDFYLDDIVGAEA